MPLLPFLPVFRHPVLLRSSSTSDAKTLESAPARPASRRRRTTRPAPCPRRAGSRAGRGARAPASARRGSTGRSPRPRGRSRRRSPRGATARTGARAPPRATRGHGRDRGHHRHARAGDVRGALHDEPQRVGREVRPRRARRPKCASACAFNCLRRSARLSSGSRFNDDDDAGDVSVARPPPRRGLRGVRARPDVGAGVVHAVREVRDRGGAGGRDIHAAHRAGGPNGARAYPVGRSSLSGSSSRVFTLSDVGWSKNLRRRVRLATPERAPREVWRTPSRPRRPRAASCARPARSRARPPARARAPAPRAAASPAVARSTTGCPTPACARRSARCSSVRTCSGQRGGASERAAVEEAQVALEAFTYASNLDPGDLDSLAGKWRLRWTNANDVLSVLRPRA